MVSISKQPTVVKNGRPKTQGDDQRKLDLILMPPHVSVAVLVSIKMRRGNRGSLAVAHFHQPQQCHRYTLGYEN